MQELRSLALYHGYSSFQFGLFVNHTLIAEDQIEGTGTCANFLPKLGQLLTKTNTSLSNIAFCAAYTGPGSFTALRVTLAFANGFAFAQNIPLVGVSGFEALAKNLAQKSESKYLIQAFKAFGEEIYLQITDPQKVILLETCTPAKGAVELLKLIPATSPCYFVGNGIPLLLEYIGSSYIRSHPENVLDLTPAPNLHDVATCGLENYLQQTQEHQLVYNLQPTYLKNPLAHT